MFQLVNFVKSFARNEEGQDLLEYALLVALIALIAIGAVGMAGTVGEHDLHQHRERAERHRDVVSTHDSRGARRHTRRAPRTLRRVVRDRRLRNQGGAVVMQSPVAIAVLRSIEGLRRSEDGQDLLEYGLLMALIAVIAIGAVTTVGNTINSVFWQVIAINY